MSNLDWLRTLSAERLVDWFYSEWLGKMAKQTTNSMLYMTEWLNSERNEVIPYRLYEHLEKYWCECGWHLGGMQSVKYCPECGKKINWEGIIHGLD